MSGEHRSKRSDITRVLGKFTQASPVYYHDGRRLNRKLPSANADLLKSTAKLCEHCNTTLTQPYDRAWERLGVELDRRIGMTKPGAYIRVNRIWPSDTAKQMRHMQLYFVKLFGCHVLETGIAIDVNPFRRALLDDRIADNVYLSFGTARRVKGQRAIIMTDMHVVHRQIGNRNEICWATWIYTAGDVAVNVTYALPSEMRRAGMVGAWHPRYGTNRLLIGDLT